MKKKLITVFLVSMLIPALVFLIILTSHMKWLHGTPFESVMAKVPDFHQLKEKYEKYQLKRRNSGIEKVVANYYEEILAKDKEASLKYLSKDQRGVEPPEGIKDMPDFSGVILREDGGAECYYYIGDYYVTDLLVEEEGKWKIWGRGIRG